MNIRSAGTLRETDPKEAPFTLSALRELASDVDILGDAVRQLGRLNRLQSRSASARAGVVVGKLAIDTSTAPATAATMTSIEEINTVATSYSTHEPDWAGSSPSTLLVNGTYDGSLGDTELNFQVTQSGFVGVVDTEIEVTDGSGAFIETLTFDSTGGTQTISGGLDLTLGFGAPIVGDSFSFDVFASVETSVQASAAFDGTGDEAPEFDPGRSVAAGAFTLNGVSINVADSDSLLDVLDSINSSAAGVTAVFDVATERVLLSQNSLGATPTISFGTDTSGFLNAVKLRGAAATPGSETGTSESTSDLLGNINSLASVTSGSFLINGETIEVDVSSDSLADVLARMNAATEVNATVDDSGRVMIAGLGRRSFELASDDSGLFAALGIDLQRYVGRTQKQSTKIAHGEGVRQALLEVHGAFNALMRGPREGVSSPILLEVRSRLSTSVGSVFSGQLELSGAGRLRSGLGVDLTKFDDTKTRSMDIDPTKLSKALRAKDGGLVELLFGREDGTKGLVEALQESIAEATESLANKLAPDGSLGLRLDVTA